MIIILEPNASDDIINRVILSAESYKGIKTRTSTVKGEVNTITEIYVLGDTKFIPLAAFEGIIGVARVIRVQQKYRVIGRHSDINRSHSFTYNGVVFDESEVHIFAGLCAVDNPKSVETMFQHLQKHGIVTTRMGAYKPRTSPYDFQGLGKSCLPWVFKLAGKYGIKIIAMEVTHPECVDEIEEALEAVGNPTGVMLQIGTRNAQNFNLLKRVGSQTRFPVLFKRGMGISLEESLNAVEYVASEGNRNIVFCLRGVLSILGKPHRNLVDFAHVPVVRRQTTLPVCVDPSHSTGTAAVAPDGIPDVFHVVGQGIVAGASMVLIDFHPSPKEALCDGPQALTMDMLGPFLKYAAACRKNYLELMQICEDLPKATNSC